MLSAKKAQIQRLNIGVCLKPLQAIYKEMSGSKVDVGLGL
jgi:hypothetical protein